MASQPGEETVSFQSRLLALQTQLLEASTRSRSNSDSTSRRKLALLCLEVLATLASDTSNRHANLLTQLHSELEPLLFSTKPYPNLELALRTPWFELCDVSQRESEKSLQRSEKLQEEIQQQSLEVDALIRRCAETDDKLKAQAAAEKTASDFIALKSALEEQRGLREMERQEAAKAADAASDTIDHLKRLLRTADSERGQMASRLSALQQRQAAATQALADRTSSQLQAFHDTETQGRLIDQLLTKSMRRCAVEHPEMDCKVARDAQHALSMHTRFELQSRDEADGWGRLELLEELGRAPST